MFFYPLFYKYGKIVVTFGNTLGNRKLYVFFADSMSSFEVSSVHFGVGYYNPVPPPSEEAANAASSNNYSSFIGADIPFSIQVGFVSCFLSRQ